MTRYLRSPKSSSRRGEKVSVPKPPELDQEAGDIRSGPTVPHAWIKAGHLVRPQSRLDASFQLGHAAFRARASGVTVGDVADAWYPGRFKRPYARKGTP